jgi:hypothetical protein
MYAHDADCVQAHRVLSLREMRENAALLSPTRSR